MFFILDIYTHVLNDILHYVQIDMAAVLDYQPGKAIPQITMELISKQLKEVQPMNKYITVELKGVHEQTSLHLMCTHLEAATG